MKSVIAATMAFLLAACASNSLERQTSDKMVGLWEERSATINAITLPSPQAGARLPIGRSSRVLSDATRPDDRQWSLLAGSELRLWNDSDFAFAQGTRTNSTNRPDNRRRTDLRGCKAAAQSHKKISDVLSEPIASIDHPPWRMIDAGSTGKRISTL